MLKQHNYKNTSSRAFTLIELIVVITILAILGAIGFVTMTGYFAGARDSARLSDMNSIYGQLGLTLGMDGTLPPPENARTITLSGTTITHQGYAGKTVLTAIKFEKGGRDPKDDTYYTYTTDRKGKQAQLMGYFEEYDVTKLSKTSDIIPQVYAIAPTNYSDRKIGTLGKKICILVEPETLSPVQVASTGILNITSTNTTPYGVYCDSNNIATSATGIVLQTFLTTNSIVNTGANNAGGGNSGTPAICGSANGSSGSIVPVANLCGGSSTLSGSVTGNGPWNWTCASSDGGAPASCSVLRAPNPIVMATDCTINTNTSWTGIHNCDTLLITNNSTLTLQGNTTTGSGVIINANNITVDAGSKISADGQGYTAQSGTGKGTTYAGAGYGGNGSGSNGTPGSTYGSNTQPVDLGSGGGNSNGAGGKGGGAIKMIVSGNVNNNGIITANGNTVIGNHGGGGSGGSIWIDAGILSGNGIFSVNGGSYAVGNYGGGGGGGRIAIYYNTKTFNGTMVAGGGTGDSGSGNGGAGTVYEHLKP